MTRKVLAIGGVAALLGIALGAAYLLFALPRTPDALVALRVVRRGPHTPARDPHATLVYVAHDGIGGITRPLLEGPRSPPVTWTTTLEATLEGDALVLSVPLQQRSVRDEHLRELQLDGLTFVFDPQGLASADAAGRLSITAHEADGGRFDVDSDGLRDIEVTIDSTVVPALRFVEPATLPVVSPEESDLWRSEPTEREDPFETLHVPAARLAHDDEHMPELLVRPNAELGIAFTLEPHEHAGDCLCAFLVMRSSLEGLEGPSPLVDRGRWQALLAADIAQRGCAGGTPTLTLDPVGRSVWLHAPPGEQPQADDLALVVGCPDGERMRVGLLGLEVRGLASPRVIPGQP
ncbi:MAG: hypothetical protein U0353_02685 [Sandaracinus sp.]